MGFLISHEGLYACSPSLACRRAEAGLALAGSRNISQFRMTHETSVVIGGRYSSITFGAGMARCSQSVSCADEDGAELGETGIEALRPAFQTIRASRTLSRQVLELFPILGLIHLFAFP
jgi:hypothetical protein